MKAGASNKDKPFVALIDINSANDAKQSHSFSVIEMNDPCNGIEARQYLTTSTTYTTTITTSEHSNANRDERNSNGKRKTTTKNSNHIYEIQNLPHPKSKCSKYSSFFVGSRVIQNPLLHLINRVDPLFLLLAYFDCKVEGQGEGDVVSTSTGEPRKQNWQPWNQICQSKGIDHTLQKVLKENKLQLQHFFEINNYSVITSDSNESDDDDNTNDDDFVLYKFQVDKVLKWLQTKVKNVEVTLKKQFLSRRKWEERQKVKENSSDNGGAFSSSFILPGNKSPSSSSSGRSSKDVGTKETCRGEEDITPASSLAVDNILLTKEEESKMHVSSIQIICEYLSPLWQAKLVSSLNMDTNKTLYPLSTRARTIGSKGRQGSKGGLEGNNNNNTKRPSTVSPISIQNKPMSESEKLLLYTMGSGNTGGSGSSTNDGDTQNDRKRKTQQAKTAGLKRLEKVNTKGMKKLSSFFGPASKKKKTNS